MTILNKIKNRINSPELALLDLHKAGLIHLSDKNYLEILYKTILGYRPDLDNPKTFNKKIQWMKLYYRKPELPGFVDKYEAKKECRSYYR